MDEFTFGDFREVMIRRKRTVDDLVDLFRGTIEEPREFFERVMSCKYKHEDRSAVVIPYRSVLQFYAKEKAYLEDSEREQEKARLKRKRGPVSEEQRQSLLRNLEKARAARSVTVGN
jgi:hypothetical protein